MLSKILTLYTTAMAEDVRTPIPHLVGPPGCGKSMSVERAASLLGVQLHTINVSRISPLELEGVQMPMEGKLELLLATYWSQLKEGDILLLDEFLRGFPEVYNGLLDILTSRVVAGHKLPPVFIIAASNSTVAYDPALTDRLLHLPVADPRKNKNEHTRICSTICNALQLMPDMAVSFEMDALVQNLVWPMYTMLDPGSRNAAVSSEGLSPRNLIGQARLRYVTNGDLADLLAANNGRATNAKKYQYLRAYMYKGSTVSLPGDYVSSIGKIWEKLSKEQQVQASLNLQLIDASSTMSNTERV